MRGRVRDAYSAAALRPGDSHAFPAGREFAESLGYPAELLATIPTASVDAFAGVSNVSVFGEIPLDATVLDLGCGAGLDSLIAARRTGPGGRVIGVDFSAPMLARARESAAAAGIGNVVFCRADAETLPIEEGSVNVTLVNGIFNLNPERDAIFRELARVMRHDCRVYAAELILSQPEQNPQQNERDWFA